MSFQKEMQQILADPNFSVFLSSIRTHADVRSLSLSRNAKTLTNPFCEALIGSLLTYSYICMLFFQISPQNRDDANVAQHIGRHAKAIRDDRPIMLWDSIRHQTQLRLAEYRKIPTAAPNAAAVDAVGSRCCY